MTLAASVRRVYRAVRRRYHARPITARPPATAEGLATLLAHAEADLLIRHGAYPPPARILTPGPRLVTVGRLRRDLPDAVRALVAQALSERGRNHA